MGKTGKTEGSPPSAEPGRRRRARVWRPVLFTLLALAAMAGIGRAWLPSLVRDYVNRTLDRNPLYAGTVGEIDIHLLRGAYSISDVRINKRTGEVPVPLFAAKRVDFAIQWNALWHGKIVGRVHMLQPELNFVDAGNQDDSQTGAEGGQDAAGGPWLQMIRDLFPFRINSAVIRNGAIHFRAFQAEPPVDVFLSEVQASLDNLTNIRDETAPMISSVQLTALAMDQAKFEYRMTFDPFSYRPTFQMAARLLGLDVTRINDFARSYGHFDFERGWFDLVIEARANEGLLKGYVKPLFRNLQVFSLARDLHDGNVLELFWEALVGAATSLFKNQPRDQFGTLIPFTGDLSQSTTTDLLATVGNVLRNAFVRAYLPRLEGGQPAGGFLQFQPPEIHDPVSPQDTL